MIMDYAKEQKQPWCCKDIANKFDCTKNQYVYLSRNALQLKKDGCLKEAYRDPDGRVFYTYITDKYYKEVTIEW